MRQCGSRGCGYGVRVANDNSGTSHSVEVLLVNISSDHNNVGVECVYGQGVHLNDSDIGSSLGDTPAVDIQSTFGTAELGAQATILNNRIDNNGDKPGIRLQVGSVEIRGNRLSQNTTGILIQPQPAGTVISDVEIGNNYITHRGKGAIGIDLSQLAATSDWITIVGNTIYLPPQGGASPGTPIALPSAPANLGVHSRITDNPGYNPPEPTTAGTPAVPSTSGALVFNPYLSDAMVAITPGSSVTLNTVTLMGPDGVTQPYLNSPLGLTGSQQVFVPVPCGYSIALTFTHVSGAKPSWNWIPT